MKVDPFLILTAQYFLALLLFATGLHKAANLSRLMAAVSAYRMVPAYFERSIAWIVIAIELTIATALLVPSSGGSVSLAAAGVFAVYFFVMVLGLSRGHREIDCGCSLHAGLVPLSGAHLVRNVVLTLLAIVASMPDSRRAVGWLDGLQITAAVLCFAMIYLTVDSLLANRANAWGV